MIKKSIFMGIISIAATTTAHAGECPADQYMVDALPESDVEAKDVTDNVIASLDSEHHNVVPADRNFRLRRLEIAPGGVVPWHSHEGRPAIIYVMYGTVTEYASTCNVPIVHHAGEATPEMQRTSHWWENTGDTTAILLSADLAPKE